MNDCIEREAVWNALNEIGGCGAEADSWADGWDKAINAAIRIVEKLPAADVAKVVRCKDCKYYSNRPNGLCYAHTKPYGNGYKGDAICVDDDNFCCFGDRKE